MLEKLLNIYCKTLDGLLAIILSTMVILVFTNVVLRYAFNSSIIMSEEVSRWGLVWLTFIGAIVALKEGSHISVDLVINKLPLWLKKLCLLMANLLMIYATWILLSGSLIQAEINAKVIAPATGLPMVIVDAAGIFFSISALLILLVGLVDLFRPINKKEII